ncbi:MAG: glycosyltransferase family 4 protein [Actinomycetota bacterium]
MSDFGAKLKTLFGKVSGSPEEETREETTGVLLPMDFENEGVTKVLLVTRGFAGGVEAYLYSLIERLGKEGYRVHVAGPRGSLVDDLKATKVVTFPLDFDDTFSPVMDWSAARKLAKIIKTEEIRMVHAHGYKAGFIAGLAARRAKTPLTLVTLHDYIVNEGHGRMKRLFFDITERYMPGLADYLIAVSDALRKRVIEKGKIEGSKVKTIYAGVKTASLGVTTSRRVLNVKNVLQINISAPLIVTVGHLTAQKGVKYLLMAAPHVLREFPNAQFLIIGEGPQKHELEIQAEKLGIHKKVMLTGWRDDARDIVAAADIFVLPSLVEGLPYSLLEAMSAGKPVVATSTGGIPEVVVDKETGFLVPIKKPMALADAVNFLIHNKDVAVTMGVAGKRRIEEHFDQKKIINATIDVYSKLFHELEEYEKEIAAKNNG